MSARRHWRHRIIEASALVEAGIDFSDEGDVPDELIAPAREKIEELRIEIEETLASSARGERLREGLVVAIAGPPNAGKSTLLNRLARREAAIVSPHAGTTRDVIEVQLDLDGFPVVLLDTAGIRHTSDPVEEEGVRRARDRAAEADLVLWLTELNGRGGVAGGLRLPRVRSGWWRTRSTWLAAARRARRPIPCAATFRISAAQGQGARRVDGVRLPGSRRSILRQESRRW